MCSIINNTFSRSLVSEKVLEKLPASCKYSDHGCQVYLFL